LDEINLENRLQNLANSGIISSGGEKMNENISGAISGALNPESDEAKNHAEKYYKSIRKMKTDYINIAKNTGMLEKDILEIKRYLFVDKHDLINGHERFDPHYSVAQSWQRLVEGKNIKEQDIILLNHELMEMRLVKNGMTQDEAHIIATKQFNYREAFERGI
jgi:hypothetical protein